MEVLIEIHAYMSQAKTDCLLPNAGNFYPIIANVLKEPYAILCSETSHVQWFNDSTLLK